MIAVPHEYLAGRFSIQVAFADIGRNEDAALIDATLVIVGIVIADAMTTLAWALTSLGSS